MNLTQLLFIGNDSSGAATSEEMTAIWSRISIEDGLGISMIMAL
jgi:hypothetical protein